VCSPAAAPQHRSHCWAPGPVLMAAILMMLIHHRCPCHCIRQHVKQRRAFKSLYLFQLYHGIKRNIQLACENAIHNAGMATGDQAVLLASAPTCHQNRLPRLRHTARERNYKVKLRYEVNNRSQKGTMIHPFMHQTRITQVRHTQAQPLLLCTRQPSIHVPPRGAAQASSSAAHAQPLMQTATKLEHKCCPFADIAQSQPASNTSFTRGRTGPSEGR
jgi:hypothetical protein